MAWTDASRKGAAVKKAMNQPPPIMGGGMVSPPPKVYLNPHEKRGYTKYKMQK